MPEKRSAVGLLPWGLALICALCAGLLAERYWIVRSENELLRSQQDLAEVAAKTASTQLEAEDLLARRLADRASSVFGALNVTVLTPTANGPAGAAAAVAWDPGSRQGMLVSAGLPANAPDGRYELWTAADQPTPIMAFTVRTSGATKATFNLPAPVAAGTKLAIRRAKSVPPEGTPLEGEWLMLSRPAVPDASQGSSGTAQPRPRNPAN